ncbi:hypothetical protein HYFRA_00010660 [Hymenoscyphus fraxineus]|uniref:SRR1-like domain-containing protein n=1 Tax=Hymenoscyphus fraxineus TaxID=746836 RepID=A0A9N9L7Y5_9HELO|nr:hypothetical protein HYFRA_00010660 [Hymenoscyphus fraxineus]
MAPQNIGLEDVRIEPLTPEILAAMKTEEERKKAIRERGNWFYNSGMKIYINTEGQEFAKVEREKPHDSPIPYHYSWRHAMETKYGEGHTLWTFRGINKRGENPYEDPDPGMGKSLATKEIRETKDLEKKREMLAELGEKNFFESTEFFLESTLYKQLMDELKKEANKERLKGITNMVTFGGSDAMPLDRWEANHVLKCVIQHRTMYDCREVIRGFAGKSREEISAYAQDPMYTEEDALTLGRVGVEVTGARFNQHDALTKLNENSFVFDFIACYPVENIIFEITRPAAIFTYCCIDEETFTTYSATKDKYVKFEGADYKIPGHTPMQENYKFEQFQADYKEIALDVSKLLAGKPGGEDKEAYRDGWMGYSYLGYHPHLYIRRW